MSYTLKKGTRQRNLEVTNERLCSNRKRCCKHHRRQIVIDMLGNPRVYGPEDGRLEGSIITWASARGKHYPYSSFRQNKRQMRRAFFQELDKTQEVTQAAWEHRHNQEIDAIKFIPLSADAEAALDQMMDEVRDSMGVHNISDV